MARQRGCDRDCETLRATVVIEPGCRCERCGIIVVSNKREATASPVPVAEVDRIGSITDRPGLRLERSNLRVLCKPSHLGRAAKDQGVARG
ncbi:hypothetical protein [Azospirillum picis]|uniref:HNH endonuclease n=1 Tax=Azospirillum picis TaxID=488438 RepID=A0ABU0MTT4_9PROT|nr:hypothetical protein [Azospirillum picis]MBP2302871.1 hypothetical protein [Azospirillum picis]MDQ0536624.1 hypothetical protein [Azospirillum picis]